MKLGLKTAELYNYEQLIIERRNTLWQSVNAHGDCDLTPTEIMRERPTNEFFTRNVSWGKQDKSKINISGGNLMLLDQIGRALAMVYSWEIVDSFDEMHEPENYPKMPAEMHGYTMAYGTMMMHKVTNRIVGVGMVRKQTGSNTIWIAETFNWNTIAKKWSLHGITIQVRETGFKPYLENAFTYNRRLNEFSAAYTKYHFLAEFLHGRSVNILADECTVKEVRSTTYYKAILYSFRHELWARICGYDGKTVVEFEQLFAEAREDMKKMVANLKEEV